MRISSPGERVRMLATRLMESVVPEVKMISSGEAALRWVAMVSRARSWAEVASRARRWVPRWMFEFNSS